MKYKNKNLKDDKKCHGIQPNIYLEICSLKDLYKRKKAKNK